jgi:hypothetical protein
VWRGADSEERSIEGVKKGRERGEELRQRSQLGS